jgi:hypothetical protein
MPRISLVTVCGAGFPALGTELGPRNLVGEILSSHVEDQSAGCVHGALLGLFERADRVHFTCGGEAAPVRIGVWPVGRTDSSVDSTHNGLLLGRTARRGYDSL